MTEKALTINQEIAVKTLYKIIYPDGETKKGEVDWPRNPGYERIHDFMAPIFGTDFEHTAVLADFEDGKKFRPLDMFVDGIGSLKKLPRNEKATDDYRRANLMGKTPVPPVDDPEKLHQIVGPVVYFNRRIWR